MAMQDIIRLLEDEILSSEGGDRMPHAASKGNLGCRQKTEERHQIKAQPEKTAAGGTQDHAENE